MIVHDSKDRFYVELELRIESGEISSKEFIDFILSSQKQEPEENTSEFYEVCSKFSDISLNAPKFVDHKTCDVQASFQFTDIDIAKVHFKNFMRDKELNDVEGVLDAIGIMHRFAVAWDDPRVKSGIVHPEGYDWTPVFAGKYHNFCELPEDIWQRIRSEIIEELA